MKLYKYILLISLFCVSHSFSQKIIKHKVTKGESIFAIAKKYDVTEQDIYDLNPKIKGEKLQLKTILQIPNKNSKANKKQEEKVLKKGSNKQSNGNDVLVSTKNYTVKKRETLSGISRDFGVNIKTIYELNPTIKAKGLKAGQKILLPDNHKEKTEKVEKVEKVEKKIPILDENPLPQEEEEEVTVENDIVHKVLPKETLYRISKKYKISVSKLKELNPSLESGLPVGYDLIIKKGNQAVLDSIPVIEEPEPEIVYVKPLSLENSSKIDYIISKASEHIGTHYRSGGTTSAGYDCSGLMIATFKEIDMTLPRTSNEQSNFGVRINRAQAQKGDLIFFCTSRRGRINHVGMITEVNGDEIKFIHSSIHSGVIISSTKEAYYARCFRKINRVVLEK